MITFLNFIIVWFGAGLIGSLILILIEFLFCGKLTLVYVSVVLSLCVFGLSLLLFSIIISCVGLISCVSNKIKYGHFIYK